MWYVNKINPWNNIKAEEVIYFKSSSNPVTAKTEVKTFCSLNLLHWFGGQCETGQSRLGLSRKTRTKNPKKVKLFNIDKTGYGSVCAWIIVKEVGNIKL